MILGRDLLKALVLNFKWSYHIIEEDYGPFKWSTTPMVDLSTHEYNYLNTRKITLKESFTNDYAE